MSGAALCSVQLHRIVPCQVTLTHNDVLHVHQSTISADKDTPAKNINLDPGLYGCMVQGCRVRLREHLINIPKGEVLLVIS